MNNKQRSQLNQNIRDAHTEKRLREELGHIETRLAWALESMQRGDLVNCANALDDIEAHAKIGANLADKLS